MAGCSPRPTPRSAGSTRRACPGSTRPAGTWPAMRLPRSRSCTAPCTRSALRPGPSCICIRRIRRPCPAWTGSTPTTASRRFTAYYVMKIGRLPLIPYYRPGDPKLGDAIRGSACRHCAVLLANHGPVVSGATPRRRRQRDRGVGGDGEAVPALAQHADSSARRGADRRVERRLRPGRPVRLTPHREPEEPMPKFAANLTMMFNEVPFPERFFRAAKAGFKGVEFLFPYDHAPQEVAGWLQENRLTNAPVQHAPRRLDGRRTGHRLPAGARGGLSRQRGEGARLRAGARDGAPARHGGTAARGRGPGEAPRRLRRKPALRRAGTRQGGPHASDRADQYAGHSRLFPQHAGRRTRDLRGGRRSQPQGPNGFLSHPDRPGRREP